MNGEDEDDPKPVYMTTSAPPYELATSAIVCICFALYLLLVGLVVMLKQILQARGMCHEFWECCRGDPTQGPGLKCCDCCINLSEKYPCLPLVKAMQSTPRKKKLSLIDSCCGKCCCGSGNAEICNLTTWRIDQYCHYLRCCGCIIRFNEPYTMWNLDADPFHDLYDSVNLPQDKEETQDENDKPNKESFLKRMLKGFRHDDYDMTGINIKSSLTQNCNTGKFTAAYGPGYTRNKAGLKETASVGPDVFMPAVMHEPRFAAGFSHRPSYDYWSSSALGRYRSNHSHDSADLFLAPGLGQPPNSSTANEGPDRLSTQYRPSLTRNSLDASATHTGPVMLQPFSRNEVTAIESAIGHHGAHRPLVGPNYSSSRFLEMNSDIIYPPMSHTSSMVGATAGVTSYWPSGYDDRRLARQEHQRAINNLKYKDKFCKDRFGSDVPLRQSFDEMQEVSYVPQLKQVDEGSSTKD